MNLAVYLWPAILIVCAGQSLEEFLYVRYTWEGFTDVHTTNCSFYQIEEAKKAKCASFCGNEDSCISFFVPASSRTCVLCFKYTQFETSQLRSWSGELTPTAQLWVNEERLPIYYMGFDPKSYDPDIIFPVDTFQVQSMVYVLSEPKKHRP